MLFLSKHQAHNMNSECRLFSSLHRTARPLLLPNVWDAASARLVEDAGARAIATSSAAVAWSLGYADGNHLPRSELIDAVRRITRVVKIPVTIDIENGYSNVPAAVLGLVDELVGLGVVGFNIEDGVDAPEILSEKIRAIRSKFSPDDVFLNARTDVYLRGFALGERAVEMSIERLLIYQSAGADGGFVPGLRDCQDIRAIARACDLPLNVMAVKGLPNIESLFAAGMRRLSIGPALFQRAYWNAQHSAKNFLAMGDVAEFFTDALPSAQMNAYFTDSAQGKR